MNDLETWIEGSTFQPINSYNELKNEILQHSKRDFLFFPFLLGYVERFAKNGQELKYYTCQVIFDLMTENNASVYFVTSKTAIRCLWATIEDVKIIIGEVEKRWTSLNGKTPDMNEIIWVVEGELD